jgi:hypothetical protein
MNAALHVPRYGCPCVDRPRSPPGTLRPGTLVLADLAGRRTGIVGGLKNYPIYTLLL